jgi:hypothetical protein
MVSLAPNSQGFVMTHMMHSFAPKPALYTPNSIMDKISCTPSLSCFKEMIMDAKMDAMFSDPQADFTIFVVQNNFLPPQGGSRKNVRVGLFNRRLTLSLLQDTPISSFNNVDNQKVFVKTVNGQTTLNGVRIVCSDIVCCNGIIHILESPM